MSVRSGVFVTCFTFLFVPVVLFADPEVLPCGEVIYDSTFVTINANDSETVVDVLVKSAVLKLVSDDYLLSYQRTTSEAEIQNDEFAVDIGDTLPDLSYRREWLKFSFCSKALLEDTLSYSVWTRTYYPRVGGDGGFKELNFGTYFHQTREHFGNWPLDGGPYERLPTFIEICSNQSVTAKCDNGRGWGEVIEGDTVAFTTVTEGWWLNRRMLNVVLDSTGTISEQLTEQLSYELTAETREAVPNIIIQESVQTSLHSSPMHPDQVRGYNLYSEIQLEPELAGRISPLWLWFPNDQTMNANVILQGTRISAAHGNIEVWESFSLPIRTSSVDGISGFFIHVPPLVSQIYHNLDHWTEIWLIVTASQGIEADSSRFILVTAPMDPSIVRFTIPAGLEFTDWSSPFENVERGFTNGRPWLAFTGICAEPGVARVMWGPAEGVEKEKLIPDRFEIVSVAPNPFNSRTSLTYTLPVDGLVSLSIRDAMGREVWSEETAGDAGENVVSIDAESMPAGIYFLEVIASGKVQRVKIVALK